MGELHLPKLSSLKAFFIALLITVLIAVAAIVIALVSSAHGSGTGGIGTYAGGISSNFITLLLLALPVVFVIAFLIFRRSTR